MVGSVSLVEISPYTPFRDNFIILGQLKFELFSKQYQGISYRNC